MIRAIVRAWRLLRGRCIECGKPAMKWVGPRSGATFTRMTCLEHTR